MRAPTLPASFLLFTHSVSVVTVALLMLPAGSLAQASLFDPAFAVGSGVNGLVYSIVIQEDGKIIIGGEFTKVAGQTRTNLARLNGNGQLTDVRDMAAVIRY